jgi:phospholipid/cholesterol/gamma-HCH transport system substrate-binding protein
MSRAALREVRVGLVVLLGIAGLFALVVLAHGGPGFLTRRRTIDVVFRDGQGVRVGNPVRVAGIEAGRVQSVDLVDREGELWARVRITVPEDLAERLRQDVQITVESGLTGQCAVNVVGAGRSGVALVPGQVVVGVESSFFDPILEQVGLGPVERKHLSHVVAEVRQTMDEAGPRLRAILGSLQDTAADVRETVAAARPRVEATVAEVEGLARSIDDAKLKESIVKLAELIAQVDALVAENRPALLATLQSVQGLAAEVRDLAAKNRPAIEALLAGLNVTRGKLDKVLANAESLTDQAASLLASNRADIDRTVVNVRDATSYGLKLVQKLYGNPFYLSPFYKPKPEDLRAEAMYDAATTFLNGAKELNDAVKTLEAMRSQATTKREQDAYNRLFFRAWEVMNGLGQTQQRLAEGLRENTAPRR